MIEKLRTTRRKARKPHVCDYCRGAINPGEVYQVDTLKYDEIYTWKAHVKCTEIAAELWDYADPDDYGMDSDLFLETCADFCRIFVCPDCEKWDREATDCRLDETYCIDKAHAFLQDNEFYCTREKYGRRCWKCRKKEAATVEQEVGG